MPTEEHVTYENRGMLVSWPVIGMAGAFLLSVVTGAIKLGGVQTQVEINTGRLDKLEAAVPLLERSLVQADAAQVANIGGIRIRQETNEARFSEALLFMRERLTVIEQTRPTAGELQSVAKSTNDQVLRILDRVDRLERRNDKQ